MHAHTETAWWKQPLRIIRYDPLNDFTDFMNGDYAEHAREVRRVCHANCEWVMANGGSSPGTASVANFDSPHFEKNPTLGDRDVLRDYLPHARAEGIRVIAYINLHWFSYAFADEYPGWEQQLADGTAYGRKTPLYGNGTTLCVNTPWRDWAYLLISEAMSTGIDGVFLDGPVVFPGACYCPVCRKLYAESHEGAAPPEVEDWSDDWLSWVDFREESMERFLAGAQQAVRDANPEGIVYLNAGGFQLSTRSARHPWRLEHFQEMTGAEVFVHFGVAGEDIHDTTVMAKFLSAGKNPAIVFSDHATGGWHYVGLSEPELCREFYQTAAGGASPWIAVFTPALEHQHDKTLAPVSTGWGRLETLEPWLAGDEPATRIAVLRSESTALAYRSNLDVVRIKSGAAKEQDLIATAGSSSIDDPVALKRFCEELSLEEFRGWCDILTRQHFPFDVIREKECDADSLGEYDVLILPNTACLPESAQAEIREYVAAGGVVVSTFETGWYDERGIRRKAGSEGLGTPVPGEIDAFAPASFEEYAVVTDSGDGIGGFDTGELLPRPEYALKLALAPDIMPGANYLNPIGAHYRQPQGVSDHPMFFWSEANMSGGRWVRFSCLPGRAWRRYRVPAWEKLIDGVIPRFSRSPRQLETDAPTTVQIEIRRQNAPTPRTLVHIINNSGNNHFPPSEIVPIGACSLSVSVPEPRRVYLAGADQIEWSWADGRLTCTVPCVEQYQILVIEE